MLIEINQHFYDCLIEISFKIFGDCVAYSLKCDAVYDCILVNEFIYIYVHCIKLSGDIELNVAVSHIKKINLAFGCISCQDN